MNNEYYSSLNLTIHLFYFFLFWLPTQNQLLEINDNIIHKK